MAPISGSEPVAAAWVGLDVVHHTRYDYRLPVALAHHLAHLQPLHDADQQLQDFRLIVDPAPGGLQQRVDALGNTEHHFSLASAHRHLSVLSHSRLRLRPRFASARPETSPPWDQLAAQLRYAAGARWQPALAYALPSPYVPRLHRPAESAALQALGDGLFRPGRPVAQAAIELMQRIHANWRYQSLSTEIDTPLSQVLAQRRGVCQDFAHLMLAVLRQHGLPARYVSGYLLTQPIDAALSSAPSAAPALALPASAGVGPALVGADASHAWVQLWCPGMAGGGPWLDLDPTNNLVPAAEHVRVAVGRDFGDVTPLRGVIRGGGEHTLHVGVTTRRIDTPPAPASPGTRVACLGSDQGPADPAEHEE